MFSHLIFHNKNTIIVLYYVYYLFIYLFIYLYYLFILVILYYLYYNWPCLSVHLSVCPPIFSEVLGRTLAKLGEWV